MVWLVNECTILSVMNWNYRIDHLDKGKGWRGFRMEGILVVYALPLRRLIWVWLWLFLTPKGKLFNNHLPELDEKFGALLV